MRRARGLSAAVLVLMVGCGGSSFGTGPAWAQIRLTISGTLDPASTNPCTRGASECVEAVLGEFRRRLDLLAGQCDHQAPFVQTAVDTTAGALAATNQPGFFRDPTFIRHLDGVFADLYFEAADAWASGVTTAVPPAWRTAFEAAAARRVSVVGDILLGLNGHITRDLPFALAKVGGTSAAAGPDRKADFSRFTEILAQVEPDTISRIARRFDPTADAFGVASLSLAQSSTATLLGAWRERARRDGERLLAAPGVAEQAAVAADIEATAAKEADQIVAATARIPSVVDRDAYCAANHARS